MANVLFVTWDGGGNVVPALEIAGMLARLGDSVRFLGQPSQREAIQKAGFVFEPYRSPGTWTATGERSLIQNSVAFLGVLTNRGFGDDLLASVGRTPTDLVVVDCLLYGPLEAARKVGLRRAVLVHSLYGVVSRMMAGGPAGTIARLAGFRPRALWASAELVIVATLRELDLPPLPADTAVALSYTGPAIPDELGKPDRIGTEPTVLVSLSTTFIARQTRILQAVLDGLAPLPVHVLVTTGPAIDGARLRVPPNAQAHRYLPHRTVMPASSALVGHGGHATTMLALAHDLPLVIIPANSQFDQPTIGRVIEEAGAGILLPASASPESIRAAVEEVLADDRYGIEAARLGAAIRASRGTTTAADLIHSLVS